MGMTDPIADMLTRIRNGYMAEKREVIIPFSNEKKSIGELLVKEGYLEQISELESSGKKHISVLLKYDEDGEKVISEITRVSKPGRRVYSKAKDIKPFLDSYGVALISTNQGIQTDKECIEKNIGGEVICTVW